MCLPKELCPSQQRFCGGSYEKLVCGKRRNIYFYIFKNTFPASDLSDGEFKGHRGLREMQTTLKEVLPGSDSKPTFELVLTLVTCPNNVVSNLSSLAHAAQSAESAEVSQFIECFQSDQPPSKELVKEVIPLLLTLKTSSPALNNAVAYMKSVAFKMDLPEVVVNDSFILQLRETHEFRDIVINGNKKGAGIKKITRFHLSREDFHFYHQNNGRMDEVHAVQCTPMMDDFDNLNAFAGDSKMDVTESREKNVRQLKANMTKTGAMCLHQAALAEKVCKKVNVIGFLADYKTNSATNILKMEFDLINRRTTV